MKERCDNSLCIDFLISIEILQSELRNRTPYFILQFFFRPVMSQEHKQHKQCDCKCDRSWVRFTLEEIQYFIFLFLRSDVKAKRGVEYCYPPCDVSINRRKVGCVVIYTRLFLPSCRIQRFYFFKYVKQNLYIFSGNLFILHFMCLFLYT